MDCGGEGHSLALNGVSPRMQCLSCITHIYHPAFLHLTPRTISNHFIRSFLPSQWNRHFAEMSVFCTSDRRDVVSFPWHRVTPVGVHSKWRYVGHGDPMIYVVLMLRKLSYIKRRYFKGSGARYDLSCAGRQEKMRRQASLGVTMPLSRGSHPLGS